MERDRLFVATVDWLERVVAEPTEYELILAAGRLRMLLLDEDPLMHQVNRERRFQLRFRIRRHPGPLITQGLVMWAVTDGLSPELGWPGYPIESVSRSVFLHERVVVYKSEDVTVRDLIQHVANVAGGVHAGKAQDRKQELLEELAEEMYLGGVSAPIRCLRGIAAVTVETLRPVRDAINAGD